MENFVQVNFIVQQEQWANSHVHLATTMIEKV